MFMHFSYGRKVKHTHTKNPTLYKTIVADGWDSIKTEPSKKRCSVQTFSSTDTQKYLFVLQFCFPRTKYFRDVCVGF